MKTKYILLLAFAFWLAGNLSAQTNLRFTPVVKPTQGGSTQVGNFKLDYTIGEPAQKTLRNGNLVFTEGFEQPDLISPPVIAAIIQVCSDSSHEFRFTRIAGIGGNQIEWSISPYFDSSNVVDNEDTLSITLAYNSFDTIWLRTKSSYSGKVSASVRVILYNFKKPTETSLPSDQIVCAATPQVFAFSNVTMGSYGNAIEWATNSAFVGSNIITEDDTVSFMVGPGVEREIFLRTIDTTTGCVSDSVITRYKINLTPTAIAPFVLRDTVCAGSSTNVLLFFPQPGKLFQLKKDTTLIAQSYANSDTISLNTGSIDSTTTFYIFVYDTLTGCTSVTPFFTIHTADTLDAPEFITGDTILFCEEQIQYIAENLNGSSMYYYIDTGTAVIDSITGIVSGANSNFIVRAYTSPIAGCYVKDANLSVQYSKKPQSPEVPPAQSAWSDTPVVFNFYVSYPARGADMVQWADNSLFTSAHTLTIPATITVTVNPGATKYIWLRNINLELKTTSDPVQTSASVYNKTDEISVPEPTYVSLYTPSSIALRTIDQSNPVGTTPGYEGTTPFGAATYSIPVVCPAGTNNIMPDIALSYNSQSSDGPLGWGWGISGLSSISRTGLDILHDQKVGPITFTNSDPFSIDGTRIIPVAGSNGADGTIYGKEVEDYSVIVSKSNIAGGPAWFQVTTKSGTVMEYGNSADSRISASTGEVLEWKLNKVYDLNGNYILYKYNNTADNGNIAEIDYTGNSSMGVAPFNVVLFNYTDRSDKNTLYTAGIGVKSNKLLYSIDVRSVGESSHFKQYALIYGKDDLSSYLTSITEWGDDASHLNPTIFQYGSSPVLGNFSLTTTELDDSYAAHVTNVDSFRDDAYGTALRRPTRSQLSGDFNGDGYSDILEIYQGRNSVMDFYEYSGVPDAFVNLGFGVYFNNPSNNTYQKVSNVWKENEDPVFRACYAPFTTYNYSQFVGAISNFPNYNYVTGDFLSTSREGILEVQKICYMDNTYKIGSIKYYTFDNAGNRTENEFSTSAVSTLQLIEGTGFFSVGDFDGDGALDYMLHFHTGSFISLPARGIFNQSVTTPYITVSTAPTPIFNTSYVIDFDGDGKQDIFCPNPTNSKVYKFSSSGSSYQFNLAVTEDYPNKNGYDQLQFGDFNGDGKTDVLSHVESSSGSTWMVQYSTGRSLTAESVFSDAFYIAESNTIDWDGEMISFPDVTSYNAAKDSIQQLILGDFNGDGKCDAILKWNYSPCQTVWRQYYSAGIGFKKFTCNVGARYAKSYMDGDFNGDGQTDVVFYNTLPGTTCNEGIDYKKNYLYTFNPLTQGKLLQRLSTAFNQITTFSYKPLTNPTVHTRGATHSNPIHSVQFPMYVLAGVTLPDGVGGNNVTTYSYTNALFHNGGRGFLGFASIAYTSSGLNTTNVIYNTYQSPYYTPSITSTATSVNGTPVLSDFNIFNQIPLGGNRYAIQKSNIYSLNKLANTYSTAAFSYDNKGNVTNSTTDVNGVEITAVTSTFNLLGEPLDVITNKTRSGSIPYTNRTEYRYDNKGRLRKSTANVGQDCSVVTEHSYNNFGNTIITTTNTTTTTGGLRSSTANYDALGRYAVSTYNTLGQLTTIETHPLWGKPTSVTGIDGLITTYEYDAYGRTTYVNTPRGNNVHFTYTWDINNSSSKSVFLVASTQPGEPTVKMYNDAFGREVRRQIMGFNGNWLTGTTTYTNLGKPAVVTQPHYSTEAAAYQSYTYDYLNRVQAVTDQRSNATTYSYSYANGNLIASTTASGRYSTQTIDGTGKVVSSTDDGGSLKFKYDSYGNQVQIKNGSVTVLTATYDACNHKTSTQEPNAGNFTYQYDGYGQLLSQTSPKGTNTTKYDVAGRATEQTTPEGTSYYSYKTTGQNGVNQIASVNSFSGTWQYFTYNSYSDLTEFSEVINGTTYTTNNTYNDYGDNETTTYPSGIQIKNFYDTYGYRTTIKNMATGNELYEVDQLNSFGQATQYHTGNGKTSYLATNFGLPTVYATSGVQLLGLTYNYTTGDLTSREDALSGNTENFEYDAKDRLTSSKVNSGTPMTYSYGNNGNITAKTDVGNYYYDNTKINAVVTVTNSSHNISDEEQNIDYISFMKASVITEGDYELTYTYDAAYNRKQSVLKQSGTIVNTKIYSGNYEVNDNLVEPQELHYVYGDNGLVAIIVRQDGDIHEYYTYTDQLGSIVKVTDDVGTVVAEQNFDSWGRKRNPADWTYTSIPSTPDWLYRGYTGHEMLPQFGLINMNGRMYDPLLGRMLSPDNLLQNPLSTQSYNRYSYVENNPLKYIDPSGWATGDAGPFSGGGQPVQLPDVIVTASTVQLPDVIVTAPRNPGAELNGGYDVSVISSNGWGGGVGNGANWGGMGSAQTNTGEKLKQGGYFRAVNGLDGRKSYVWTDTRQNRPVQQPVDIHTMYPGLLQSMTGRPATELYHIENIPVPKNSTQSGINVSQAGLFGDGKEWVGPMLIALGQPINVLKPVGALGSKPGSSIASFFLSKIFPWRFTILKKITSIGGVRGSTAVVGRALGRLVPVAGWAVTLYDIFWSSGVGKAISLGAKDFYEIQDKSRNGAVDQDGWPIPVVCFSKGTLVYSKHGLVRIETINVGDSVYTYNLLTNTVELGNVLNTLKRNAREIFEVITTNQKISVTAEHPFYVDGKGWVTTKELKTGYKLKTIDGVIVETITDIHSLDRSVEVYNIETGGNHNYFVTNGYILVHNKYIQQKKATIINHKLRTNE